MEQISNGKTKKYQMSEVSDTTTHPNLIKRIEPAQQSQCFFMMEENSSAIKLYNKNLEVIGKVETRKLSVFEQKGSIQDFAYDPINDIIGFVTTDKKMYFYEGSGRMNLLHIAEKFKKSYNGIWHLPKRNLWAVSSVDNYLIIWRVHKTGLIFLAVD